MGDVWGSGGSESQFYMNLYVPCRCFLDHGANPDAELQRVVVNNTC